MIAVSVVHFVLLHFFTLNLGIKRKRIRHVYSQNMYKTCTKHVQNMYKTCTKHVQNMYVPLFYAKSITAWSNQSSVMCLLFILNIYLSIYLIIQLEIRILQWALTVNGNIYFYWNHVREVSLETTRTVPFSTKFEI